MKFINFTNLFAGTLLAQFGNQGFEPVETKYNKYITRFPETEVLTQTEIFISNLIGFLTILGSIFFIFNFISAALSWVGAGEDSGKVEKARTKITQSIIGLVVVVLSYAAIGLIGKIVGIDIINLRESLQIIRP